MSNRWGISIFRHDNGYLVASEPSEVEGETTAICVFEDKDDDGDLSSTESVLWHVIDHFGKLGSRYDAERIVIRREPGDKWENPPRLEPKEIAKPIDFDD